MGLAALARSCTSLRFVALAEQIRTAYIDTIHTFPSTVKVYVYETPQGGENEDVHAGEQFGHIISDTGKKEILIEMKTLYQGLSRLS